MTGAAPAESEAHVVSRDGPGPRDRLSFLYGRLGSEFERRVILVAPGESRPYAEAEWRDALIVVEHGEIELECVAGGYRRFGRGAVLCLAGLSLCALHNRGPDPAVLVAISRATLNDRAGEEP